MSSVELGAKEGGCRETDRHSHIRDPPRATSYSPEGERVQDRLKRASVCIVGNEIYFFLLLTLFKPLILILFIIINFSNWQKYLNELK